MQMTDSSPVSDFESLRAYSFTSDSEFANGLAIILNHPGTPASEEEITRDDDLVMKAKCYFFSRYDIGILVRQKNENMKKKTPVQILIDPGRKKNITPAIDFAAYKAWLNTGPAKTASVHALPEVSDEPSAETSGEISRPSAPDPAYPNSFAQIVELITTGQPIPGIEQIPDTVLEGHDISSEKPRRRKPWEKDENGTSSPDMVVSGNTAESSTV
ncbi:hypothetical protein N7539_000713 [Penicillium diatomitis]|uniref:Uncharacterized protein n=1 Tax=Penicillium diatomitis TaxID=2819901 RepID=A0A9W9XMB3_9EURO|nr:uncharacterized protein N7539_000713 [Penicillium diatomitis]KAJ5495597.1 hypothetical protein N7539_000713 [Penicillium diatomitis]